MIAIGSYFSRRGGGEVKAGAAPVLPSPLLLLLSYRTKYSVIAYNDNQYNSQNCRKLSTLPHHKVHSGPNRT